jgi:hypothetical protein
MTGGVPGAEELCAVPVNVGEDVEDAVMIAKARRPDALAIALFPIFQPELRSEVQLIEGIAVKPLIHQVLRMKHWQSRHRVHRRVDLPSLQKWRDVHNCVHFPPYCAISFIESSLFAHLTLTASTDGLKDDSAKLDSG